MKVKLTAEQIKTIKSMNNYWEEIAHRPDKFHMIPHEIDQMFSVLTDLMVLLIVGEYVKHMEDK